MQYEEYWLKAKDKARLFNRLWVPDEKPDKLVLLVHGLGEHSGRYQHWAKLFVKHNFAFLAVDLRGHGKSDGTRGDAKRPVVMIKDILLAAKDIKEKYPNVPIILYGHSMGATLVLELYRHFNNVEGLIITAPWLELVYNPPFWKTVAARFLYGFMPWMTFASDIIPEQLTKRTEIIQDLYNDTLVHRKISIRLYHDINNLAEKLLAQEYKTTVPVLVMQGEEDQLTCIDATKRFVAKLELFATFKSWPDNYHEIHNDVDYLLVFDYIDDWLKHLSKS
jgi:alpha-beta hydrolase superfamily lysophospholipase